MSIPGPENFAPEANAPAPGPFDFLTGISCSSYLLGDIWGLRSLLRRYGISLALSETSEVLGNLTGGLRQGFAYDGLTQMAVQLDTQLAFGWYGGTGRASALQIHGRNLSADNLLSLQTASGIEADPGARLWELWYDQKFLEEDRIYGVIDQMVWRSTEPAEADRSASVFLRAMGTPQADRNLVVFSMNAGLVLREPIEHRDDDTFGAAIEYARVSGAEAAFNEATEFYTGTFTPARTGETVLELTYQYQLTPAVILQPDFQKCPQPRRQTSQPQQFGPAHRRRGGRRPAGHSGLLIGGAGMQQYPGSRLDRGRSENDKSATYSHAESRK